MIKFLKKAFRLVIGTVVIFSATFLLAGAVALYGLVISLPDPSPEVMLSAPQSNKIFDRNGVLLYEAIGDIRRTRMPLDTIPKYLRDATIAIEDKNFFTHRGFDALAIARAAIKNFTQGEIQQGASTLTQQLARTMLLNRDHSYRRKLKELILSIKIERRYSKDEILEMYLNNIPYGSNAYGVEAASRFYFNKTVSGLSLKESAYLAALPKAPTAYSPYGPNADALHERAGQVLNKMEELGYLSHEQANKAIKADKPIFNRVPYPIKAPHFVFYVLDILTRQYGEDMIRSGGLNVYTSLDYDKQVLGERIVAEHSLANEKKFRATNAALVAADPASGEILAMVGSRDYYQARDGNVNVALCQRQPGSSFKPYAYATALEGRFSPATIILDRPSNFAAFNHGVSYTPKNYTGRNYGPISIRKALAGSLNVPAVKVLVSVGINKTINTAEELGISTLKNRQRFGPAIVLGGAEVKLLEHTMGLGALGSQGVFHDPAPILKILDSSGQLIFEHKKLKGRQAVDPQAAYLTTHILSDSQARVFIFGKKNKLSIPGRAVAVKTGTTQNFRDGWTIGWTPDLAVGVWVGNNDNTPMSKGADGSVVAAPIWNAFMSRALSVRPPKEFVRPKGIVEIKIDPRTGKPRPKSGSRGQTELFASYNINPAYSLSTAK